MSTDSVESIKMRTLDLLESTPQMAWSMDELVAKLTISKELVQKAVSQLQDEGKVRLRVWEYKVWANFVRR